MRPSRRTRTTWLAQGAKRLHGARRLDLREKADQGVEDQNDRNRNGFLPVAEIECETGGGAQQIDDRALQLAEKYGERADCPLRYDFVRTVEIEAALSLPFGKTLRFRN